jgi:hypothetical protein
VLDLFDYRIVQFVNSMAHRSGTMDLIVVSVLSSNLLKGAVPITMLYWTWFHQRSSANTAADDIYRDASGSNYCAYDRQVVAAFPSFSSTTIVQPCA